MTPTTFYLIVDLFASASNFPANNQVFIGPMVRSECEALALAVEAASVSPIAAVECREPRAFRMCIVPWDATRSQICPVWEDRPLFGSPSPSK